MRILIVEDEVVLAKMLKNSLEKAGYTADFLTDGEIAERRILLNSKEYDLIILDWMLPTKDGLEVCKDIRYAKINMPILMLTARFDMKDKVAALNAGADDYLVKPFSFDELEARIRALMRRPIQTIGEILKVRNLEIDLNKRKVTLNNKIIRLTNKEFSMLEYLMRNLDKVVQRDQILDHLWGFDFDSFSNVIDVHMKNLRSKLKVKGRPIIETVRGIGYRIKSI